MDNELIVITKLGILQIKKESRARSDIVVFWERTQ